MLSQLKLRHLTGEEKIPETIKKAFLNNQLKIHADDARLESLSLNVNNVESVIYMKPQNKWNIIDFVVSMKISDVQYVVDYWTCGLQGNIYISNQAKIFNTRPVNHPMTSIASILYRNIPNTKELAIRDLRNVPVIADRALHLFEVLLEDYSKSLPSIATLSSLCSVMDLDLEDTVDDTVDDDWICYGEI